jgi:hypothetical protein
MIPDLRHVVENMRITYPALWGVAHTGQSGSGEFIVKVASALHAVDGRFGLNGKRGDPRVLSEDAVCFRGFAAGGDYDPTDGGAPVTVIDVIAGAGGPNPSVAWMYPLTPSAAAWVKPPTVTAGGATPPGVAPPPPVPGGASTPLEASVIASAIRDLQSTIVTMSDRLVALESVVASARSAADAARLHAENVMSVGVPALERGVADLRRSKYAVDGRVRMNGALSGTVSRVEG